MNLFNNNRKKKTLLQNRTTLNFIKRYMESESIMLNDFDKGNSFHLYGLFQHEKYARYAEENLCYVIDQLDVLTFSQMLDQSYEKLSYQLSPQSFEAIIQGMLLHPGTCESTKRIIFLYDDLGMFNHDTFERLVLYPERKHYYALFLERNLPKALPETLPETLSDSITNSDKHISMTNSDNLKSNADSESAIFSNENNNNQIIVLTILAFTIIVVGSWLINKYYPQKEKTIEELDISTEQPMVEGVDVSKNYSVYETPNMSNYVILLLSCIVPFIISLCYSYRHYYIYKIKMFLSNINYKN